MIRYWNTWQWLGAGFATLVMLTGALVMPYEISVATCATGLLFGYARGVTFSHPLVRLLFYAAAAVTAFHVLVLTLHWVASLLILVTL